MKKIISSFLLIMFLFLINLTVYAVNLPYGYFITINKSNNILTLCKDGSLFYIYPVATGKEPSYTPEGKFSIVCKIVNPSWGGGGYAQPVAGGDPNNPLGKYWMGLSIGGGSIYGIHGTNNESSIGKYASRGCIRMYNYDIKSLFNTVNIGTEVWIGTKDVLASYGIPNNLMGYIEEVTPPVIQQPIIKIEEPVYKDVIIKINDFKMKQNGFIVNNKTHIHSSVLDFLDINYAYLGNSKFRIGNRIVSGKMIKGSCYINWESIMPNKLIPIKISGGYNFKLSKY